MYTVWIKIDENLPWIELEGAHKSKREAREEANKCLSNVKVKIMRVSCEREKMKVLATIKQ
ncbi:MAG: hypothetical protein QW717_06600 [Candidatus Bathyarchaeia archaeon]